MLYSHLGIGTTFDIIKYHSFFFLANSQMPQPRLTLILLLALASSFSAQAAIYRVGVMDFSNLSQNAEQDWVAEAFTSSVKDKMSRVSSFSVISRKNLWEIQGQVERNKQTQPEEAKGLAQRTQLDYLVFGSVQRAGDLSLKNAPLRVHARLVDTVRGIIHRAVIVDGNMSDLFDLQFRLAEAFVKQASIEISVAERKAMQSPEALSLEAYRLFNIGMLEKRAKRYEKAISAFEKAMAKHPGILYGDAHHQIGLVYLEMGRKEELLIRFKADVAQLAPVYFDLGIALRQNGDYNKAAEAFKTFVESTDNFPFLWEYEVGENEYDVYLDKKGSVVVLSAGPQLVALDAGSGEKRWAKPQERGSRYQVQNHSWLSSKEKGSPIDMLSGNLILKKQGNSTYPISTEDEDLQVLVSKDQLLVRDRGKSLWAYKAKDGEEILGHNRNAFFAKQGKQKIRALRIQKEDIPTQVDGLLQLAQCLELDKKPEQAAEVYDYLMDVSHVSQKK